MKYYAVKKGKQPGIYQTWNDCRDQVSGYSGAEFKAFEEEAAAQAYLQQEPAAMPLKDNLPAVYIDGAFSKKNACYSYGGFISAGGRAYIIQGTGNNPKFMQERNIAGELLGTLQAIYKCLKLGIREINLFFDYTGIEAYIAGSWKAKTPLAQYYKETVDLLEGDIAINYQHIKGHTGVFGNEIADYLAKEAAGAALRKKDIAALEAFREAAAQEAFSLTALQQPAHDVQEP